MIDRRPPEGPRRASDDRFRRGRAALTEALRALCGPAHAPLPLDDADRAAALAAEARAAHREASAQPWAVVRQAWAAGAPDGVSAVLHGVAATVGARPGWLIVPGREPLAVPLLAEMVLDNPFGFAALAEGHELLLLDAELPAGVWLARETSDDRSPAAHAWALEVWGTEPWLSAATRALRAWRAGGAHGEGVRSTGGASAPSEARAGRRTGGRRILSHTFPFTDGPASP